MAALAFGLTGAVQSVALGFVRNRSFGFNPTVLAVIIPYYIMQLLVFIIIGSVIGYIPSFLVIKLLDTSHLKHSLFFVFCGALMGIIFLPLCAALPYFLLVLQDRISYLARIVEFAIPMTVSGAIGGYAYWRSVYRTATRAN